mmetsp:Transcript_29088/g.70162  ORF Transcript_29088/g.70162 Transcript_29088/m.70162 type:complete len:202 (-) Transcript_29088:84-689(-)
MRGVQIVGEGDNPSVGPEGFSPVSFSSDNGSSLDLHGVPLKHWCLFGQSLLSPDGQARALSQSMLSQLSEQKYDVLRFARCFIRSMVGSGVGSGVGEPGVGSAVGVFAGLGMFQSSPSLSICWPLVTLAQSSPSLSICCPALDDPQSSPSLSIICPSSLAQSSPSLSMSSDAGLPAPSSDGGCSPCDGDGLLPGAIWGGSG